MLFGWAQALCNRSAHAATNKLFEAECIFDNHGYNCGNIGYIDKNDNEGHTNIANRHDGDNHIGNLSDALSTAKNDKPSQNSQSNGRPEPINAEAVLLE